MGTRNRDGCELPQIRKKKVAKQAATGNGNEKRPRMVYSHHKIQLELGMKFFNNITIV